jgi:hypothetical protein
LINCLRSAQHHIGAYQADGGRQPLVRTFLKGGLASPRLDGDVAPAAAWASKSYWITGQGVRATFSLLMPTEGSSPPPPPSRSEVTYTRRSCLDEPVGGPPSAMGCFGRWSPVVDPVGRETASQCQEGIVRGGDEGGRVAHLSTSPLLVDADLGEASIPHLFTVRLAVHQSLSLSPHTPMFPH